MVTLVTGDSGDQPIKLIWFAITGITSFTNFKILWVGDDTHWFSWPSRPTIWGFYFSTQMNCTMGYNGTQMKQTKDREGGAGHLNYAYVYGIFPSRRTRWHQLAHFSPPAPSWVSDPWGSREMKLASFFFPVQSDVPAVGVEIPPNIIPHSYAGASMLPVLNENT